MKSEKYQYDKVMIYWIMRISSTISDLLHLIQTNKKL